jgi:hypothetical protein
MQMFTYEKTTEIGTRLFLILLVCSLIGGGTNEMRMGWTININVAFIIATVLGYVAGMKLGWKG